jgi:hypothetical protein
MATFQEDMDTDRSAVFLDTSNGFGQAVTYTQRDGPSLGSITAVRSWPLGASEIGLFQTLDGREAALFHVSAADVSSPALGDRITAGSDTWQVASVAPADGFFELRCVRKKDTQ